MFDDEFPEEINFNDDGEEEVLIVCPCCHENEVSEQQMECNIEGEECSICNFHTWEL